MNIVEYRLMSLPRLSMIQWGWFGEYDSMTLFNVHYLFQELARLVRDDWRVVFAKQDLQIAIFTNKLRWKTSKWTLDAIWHVMNVAHPLWYTAKHSLKSTDGQLYFRFFIIAKFKVPDDLASRYSYAFSEGALWWTLLWKHRTERSARRIQACLRRMLSGERTLRTVYALGSMH